MTERNSSNGHTTIVVLQAHMPEPGKTTEDSSSLSLESKVRYLIDCIESGHYSGKEWIALNKFYRTLEERQGKDRKNKKIKNLIDMIKPVMSKYGQHGVPIKDTKVE